jgi:hypothetical protein
MIVLCAALSLFQLHGRVARRLQVELAVVSGAAWALEIASRDVELAGADPLRAGVRGLASAGPAHVVLESDLDRDGAVNPASAETIRLAWNGASGGRLQRAVGHQAMPIAARVPPGGFRLRYFDAMGAEVSPAPAAAELDAPAVARVRRVLLELEVRESNGAEQSRVTLRRGAAVGARREEP